MIYKEFKNIGIGNDHRGVGYKRHLLNVFVFQKNYGTDSTDSVDYPDYVHPGCKDLLSGEIDVLVLICGTGNGVAMTANKYDGIRAALCWNTTIAIAARKHNNANVLCIPANFVNEDGVRLITYEFLSTAYEGGRHEERLKKMSCVA